MNRFRSSMLIILLTAAATAGQLQISGLSLSAQATEEPVSIAISRDTPQNRDSLRLSLKFVMKPHLHLYSAESLFFKITIDSLRGMGKPGISLPTPESFTNFDKTIVGVYINGQQIRISCPLRAAEWSISGSIRFQACDTAMCFTPRTIPFVASSDGKLSASVQTTAPETPVVGSASGTSLQLLDGFTVVGTRGGFLNIERFSEFLRDPAGEASAKTGGFEEKGILVVIILILLGGIALNLTPCVLPMVPITLAVLGAGSQAKSRGHGMFVGGVYGLAMALTYGLLGLFVVLTGTRFGVINSSPLFNIMIAVVFILMALAMFDIIQVDFTKFRKSGAPESERGKLLTVFIMGIVASLLAGACVAPVVISVVLYAGTLYANGNMAGLALPFLLGIGMALPWPFAGAGLTFMPKPGKWMVWVKYVFGIFILLMALYYGYTGVHLYRETAAPKNIHAAEKASNLPWVTSLDEGLRKATAENKPVLIDFWATWCKNCKAMDAITFRDKGVETQMKQYVLVKFQAEQPDAPEIKKVLDRFGVVGLPTYVVLRGK